jgi:hypothetical protein
MQKSLITLMSTFVQVLNNLTLGPTDRDKMEIKKKETATPVIKLSSWIKAHFLSRLE